MIPDVTELEAVRLILRRRRSGVSYRQIAAELAGQGHRTKRYRSWHASTVREVWSAEPSTTRCLPQPESIRPGRRLTGRTCGG